jgi:hypothetical protein
MIPQLENKKSESTHNKIKRSCGEITIKLVNNEGRSAGNEKKREHSQSLGSLGNSLHSNTSNKNDENPVIKAAEAEQLPIPEIPAEEPSVTYPPIAKIPVLPKMGNYKRS